MKLTGYKFFSNRFLFKESKLFISLKLCLFLYATSCFGSGYQHVVEQYTTALQMLLKVHAQKFPNAPIELTQSNLPFMTYKKIVTPYATYIIGWAHIANNSFQHHTEYLKHLVKTQQQLQQFLPEVQAIINLFPSDNHKGLFTAFYELIGSDIVNMMFNIVQTLANQATTNPDDLQAAFIAYQLAYEIYQKDMNIVSVPQGKGFNTALVEAISSLCKNALMLLENKLSIGNLGSDSIETIYKQIQTYNGYLVQIYTDNQDAQKKAKYSADQANAAQYLNYYKKAQTDYDALETSLKNISKAVVLDVNNVTNTTNQLNGLIQTLQQVKTDATNVQTHYQQAKDIFGAGQMSNILDQINVNLWITNALDQLWLIYLQDQSSNDDANGNTIYSAPSVAAFISSNNQSSDNPVTNQEVLDSLQNLLGLISQSSNTISSLADNSAISTFSIDYILKKIQSSLLQLQQTGEKISSKNSCLLVSMISVAESIKILFYVQELLTSLINVMSQTDSAQNSISVAYAYEYAKQLDLLYKSLSSDIQQEIKGLIPYFPAQVSSSSLTNSQATTWVNWSEQIMLASGIVNSSDLMAVHTQKIKIKNSQTAQAPVSVAQLSQMMNEAHQDALEQDFSKASKGYANVYDLYSKLYELDPTQAQYLQQMQLIKTMYTASSFAAKIQISGVVQSWKNITNIPQLYQIGQYPFQNISMSNLGTNMSQVPTALISIPVGIAYTTLTTDQQKDCIQILKAYMIGKVLDNNGYEFNDIYADYKLTQNSGIDPADLKKVQQYVQQVEDACNNFKGCTVSSITLADASTIQLMVFNNLVIPRVTPLFSSMATALNFFASAQLLFGPSQTAIQLGSATYTPGNDQKLSDVMLEEMVYIYLSVALSDWQKANLLMNQVSATLPKGEIANKELPKDFSTNLNQINTYMTNAQAMLFAQGQSAYAYSSKIKNSPLTKEVSDIFFGTYKKFIDWMTGCLIGNPYQNSYRNLIMTISQTYTNWSSWLNPQADAAQIAQNTTNSIKLIEAAGDTCMKTSYKQSLYPNYNQYHYAAASNYYHSAYQAYQSNSDSKKSAAVEVKVLDAYFKGVNQNLDLFLNYVLVNGITFTHETTQQTESISFAQLMQDSQGGFSSLGEQKAYDSVKNLLLHAGMGLTYLMKKVIPSKPVNADKKQQVESETKSTMTSNVIAYLKAKNIMGATDQQPGYFKAGVATSIYATNMDAYAKFNANVDDYASWLNVMYLALQAIYAFHYLGATPGESGAVMQKQVQEFFGALQSSTVAIENNASAYGE